MANVLIVYGTTEGQTAKIAQQIADAGRRLGHEVDVRHAPDLTQSDLEDRAAVVVGGSLHQGRYQRGVRDFVERHRAWLDARPSAFFSVSLAAASRNPDERAAARTIAEKFVAAAGWTPQRIESFAGALRYTRYGWLKRMLMKYIAGKEGGDVDTSRDFEYTDWDAVTRFAQSFFGALRSSA